MNLLPSMPAAAASAAAEPGCHHHHRTGVSTPLGIDEHFWVIFWKIVTNSISDRFQMTSQGKMMFGHCQGNCKDHTNSLRWIWGPSDFTRHWKLNISLSNLNSTYHYWYCKLSFWSRVPSGDFFLLVSLYHNYFIKCKSSRKTWTNDRHFFEQDSDSVRRY